jgi:hypothetical protein
MGTAVSKVVGIISTGEERERSLREYAGKLCAVTNQYMDRIHAQLGAIASAGQEGERATTEVVGGKSAGREGETTGIPAAGAGGDGEGEPGVAGGGEARGGAGPSEDSRLRGEATAREAAHRSPLAPAPRSRTLLLHTLMMRQHAVTHADACAGTYRATVQLLQAQINDLSAKLSESSQRLAAAAAAAAADSQRRTAREAELAAEAEAARIHTGTGDVKGVRKGGGGVA